MKVKDEESTGLRRVMNRLRSCAPKQVKASPAIYAKD